MPKKKISQSDKRNEKLDKLLTILNLPETSCKFWKVEQPYCHLMGIRPVARTTLEIINKDGYNPYDKKTDEKLFKVFMINITLNEKENIISKEELGYKKDLEENGYIYLKHHDLFYIYEFIRNNT